MFGPVEEIRHGQIGHTHTIKKAYSFKIRRQNSSNFCPITDLVGFGIWQLACLYSLGSNQRVNFETFFSLSVFSCKNSNDANGSENRSKYLLRKSFLN